MIVDASKFWRLLEPAAKTFNLYEIRSPKQDAAMNAFCNQFGALCDAITSFISEGGSPYNVPEREAVCDARPASSASLKQIVHYGQIANSGIFK